MFHLEIISHFLLVIIVNKTFLLVLNVVAELLLTFFSSPF